MARQGDDAACVGFTRRVAGCFGGYALLPAQDEEEGVFGGVLGDRRCVGGVLVGCLEGGSQVDGVPVLVSAYGRRMSSRIRTCYCALLVHVVVGVITLL